MSFVLPTFTKFTTPRVGWRILHALATLSIWITGSLAAIVLLFALLLHGWIVPNIDSLRPRIERLASDRLQTQVQIGKIEAHSSGWLPSFELQDVRLQDAQGQNQLVLGHVWATLSPLSVLRMNLDQLVIDAPQLHVQRDKTGQLIVAGFKLQAHNQSSAGLDWLLSQREIIWQKGTLTWQDDLLGQAPLQFSDVTVVLRNTLRGHQMRLDATPPKAWGQSLQFIGRFTQPLLQTHASRWQTWSGNAYVQLQHPQFEALSPYVAPEILNKTTVLENAASIQLWGQISNGKVTALDASASDIPHVAKRLQLHLETVGTALNLKGEAIELNAVQKLAEKFVAANSPQLQTLAQLQLQGQIQTLAVDLTNWRTESPADAKKPNNAHPPQGHLVATLHNASAELSPWFDEPHLRLDQATLDLSWQRNAKGWRVDAKRFQFSNPDATGELSGNWQNADAASNPLGNIQISGRLQQAQLTSLHRYFPSKVPLKVRQYLKASIERGVAKDAQFKVSGALKHFPFVEPGTGEFHIWGAVADGQYAFAPETTWPKLTQIKTNFDFNRMQLAFSDTQAQFHDIPLKGAVKIADLRKATVEIQAQGKVPLARGLSLVNESPLKAISKQAFLQSTASGTVDTKVQLSIPISNLPQSKIQVGLQWGDDDNWFVLNPQTPPVSKVRGQLNLNEAGLQTVNMQAQVLGNELKVAGNAQRITGSGTVSAEGLANWKQQPLALRAAAHLQGTTPYTFQLTPPGQGRLFNLVLESNLAGLQFNLPAPFNKPAATAWPSRFQLQTLAPVPSASTSPVASGTPAPPTTPATPAAITAVSSQDRLSLNLGPIVNAEFVRDIRSDTPKVLRGVMSVGEKINLPERGVSAFIQLPTLDVSAWSSLLAAPAAPDKALPSVAQEVSMYAPTQVVVQVGSVNIAGREFQNVVLGASHEAAVWRINSSASDFDGYLEYRERAGPRLERTEGQLFARLAHLKIPDSSSKAQVEQLLKAQPDAIPALDVVIEDFEMTGKKLGRLEIQAINQRKQTTLGNKPDQEWRLQKLNLSTPESEFKASGVWSGLNSNTDARRVDLQFNWDINDSGELLKRVGFPDTLRGGKGTLQGRVAWLGSPLSLNYPTLTGLLKLDLAKGQFLKADPGVGRLLSVLSLQSLPRRLTLDFRDVFSEGFAFDSIQGDAQIKEGIISTQNLQMKSVLALISMEGSADLAKETQNLRVLVLPDINAGGASLLATIVNPIVGAATYLAQLILRRPVVAAATKEFRIEGTWRDPKVISVPHQSKPETPAAPKTSDPELTAPAKASSAP